MLWLFHSSSDLRIIKKKIKNIKVYLMFKLIKDFDLFHSAVIWRPSIVK